MEGVTDVSIAEYCRPRDRHAFEIAIICALPIESDAVEALFDEFWEDDVTYGKAPGDTNAYTTGRIGQHNVVLAFMAGMGKAHSASVAASFRSSFDNIKLGLVVGICGGVPRGTGNGDKIQLGDVIISTGVVQFDFGRQFSNNVVRKDTLQDNLGRPNLEIRGFLSKMQGLRARKRLKDNMSVYLVELGNKKGLEGSRYPGSDEDKLYGATYRHRHQEPTTCGICAKCDSKKDEVCDTTLQPSCTALECYDSKQVTREQLCRPEQDFLSPGDEALAPKPEVHFGLIASGDMVMKSGPHRDEIATREQVMAFE